MNICTQFCLIGNSKCLIIKTYISTEKALNALTIQAFIKCDIDGQMGLSWGEIEKCEEEFCPMLAVPCPNQEDFNAYDENGDGNLTVEEYFNHVNNH